jgi:hypothetical protein
LHSSQSAPCFDHGRLAGRNLCDAIGGLLAAQAIKAFATAFKADFDEFHFFITGRDVFEIPEGEQFFAVDGYRRILRALFAAFVFSANQRTLADPAEFRLGRVEGLAFRIAAPDWLRTLFAKGPEDRVHSDNSQLTISSSRGLGRIDVTGIMTGAQYWHFLRWFVIRRLVRKTSASARRSSATGALLTIIANRTSYFSRGRFTIALNFGQVARSIVELLAGSGLKNPSRRESR